MRYMTFIALVCLPLSAVAAETCQEPFPADMAKDTLYFLDSVDLKGREATRLLLIAKTLSDIGTGKIKSCARVDSDEQLIEQLQKQLTPQKKVKK